MTQGPIVTIRLSVMATQTKWMALPEFEASLVVEATVVFFRDLKDRKLIDSWGLSILFKYQLMEIHGGFYPLVN